MHNHVSSNHTLTTHHWHSRTHLIKYINTLHTHSSSLYIHTIKNTQAGYRYLLKLGIQGEVYEGTLQRYGRD